MSTDNPQNSMVPVILSGGSGTRLWPVSRRAHPKPFMKLVDGESLAEKTFRRALGRCRRKPGADRHQPRLLFSIPAICMTKLTARSTTTRFCSNRSAETRRPPSRWPPVMCRQTFGPDALMLVLPADHLIRDLPKFQAAVDEARELAGRGYLVTFGIYPTHAETGYGYIRKGNVHRRFGRFRGGGVRGKTGRDDSAGLR